MFYRSISETKKIEAEISSEVLKKFDDFVKFATEETQKNLTGKQKKINLTISDVLDSHLHAFDEKLKIESQEKIKKEITLTAEAAENLEAISKQNGIDLSLALEKFMEHVLKDKQFTKWQKKKEESKKVKKQPAQPVAELN